MYIHFILYKSNGRLKHSIDDYTLFNIILCLCIYGLLFCLFFYISNNFWDITYLAIGDVFKLLGFLKDLVLKMDNGKGKGKDPNLEPNPSPNPPNPNDFEVIWKGKVESKEERIKKQAKESRIRKIEGSDETLGQRRDRLHRERKRKGYVAAAAAQEPAK